MNMPLSVVIIFIFVPFLSILTIVISFIGAKKRENELFNVGILYLKQLRTLLMYIQQHRGLTNSYLCGNKQTETEIAKLESIVKNEIFNAEEIDAWLIKNSKWESITDHWSRLNVNFKTADAENNLKQHNYLIANLLYLIDDLAYTHQLGKIGSVENNEYDWRHLLSIAESVGQARAIGMGAVSRGECTILFRTELDKLCIKIESNINRHWAETTKADFNHFLTVIKKNVLTEKTSIPATEFFELATGCIRHVLTEFDAQVEKIQLHRV